MKRLDRCSRASSAVMAGLDRLLDPAIQPEDGTLASLPWIAASRAATTLFMGPGDRSCP